MRRPEPPTPNAAGPRPALADRALPLLFADGAAAMALAQSVLQMPAADDADRAVAHAVCAIQELREGTLAAGQQHRDAALALLAADGGEADTADGRIAALLQQVQAQCHRREGRIDDAAALLRPLHARAAQRPVIDAYVTAGSLGSVTAMQGNSDSALDVFYDALALARHSGEDALLVNALNNLGSYQADLHNLEDAATLLEECLAGALRLGSRRQTIYAAGNLVQCMCLMGQASRALALTREHLIGRIQPQDPPSLQRDEEIAWALFDNGLLDEAEAALGGPVHIDPLSNELATVRIWLKARVLLARGRAAEALHLCLRRQQLLDAEGSDGTLAIDHVHLLRVAAAAAADTGDHAEAYALLQRAFGKHEWVLGRAARSRQLSLQISHRLREAEWDRDSAQQTAARLEALNDSLQQQMAETERLRQLLQAQALEDPLTGLHNRRHLMNEGTRLIQLMRRRGEPLAAVLVDIDHFKRVNDQHGHDAGDEVLRQFALLARTEMRAEDIVCRYGGEEFVLLLPGASAAQALARTEQLLQKFTALRFTDAQGAAFGCSFSGGVAESRESGGPDAPRPDSSDGEALPALLARVDAALYAAKDAGRARLRVAP